MTITLEKILFICVLIFCFAISYQYSFVGGDIDQDVSAAYALYNNKPIYSVEGIELYQKDYGRRNIQQNFHPPILAVISFPFLYLSPVIAFNLLNVISIIVSMWSFRILIMDQVSKKTYVYLLSFFMLSFAMVSNIANGQISPLIFGLIVFSYACVTSQKEIYAGILVGFASALKIYPLFFNLIFIKKKKWGALLSALFVFLSLQILTLLFVDKNDILFFLDRIKLGTHLYASYLHNISLYSFFVTLCGEVFEIDLLNQNLFTYFYYSFICMYVAYYMFVQSSLRSYEYMYSQIILFISLMTPIFWEHGLLLCLFLIRLFLKLKIQLNIFLISLLCVIFYHPNVFVSQMLHTNVKNSSLLFFVFAKLITLALVCIFIIISSDKIRSKDLEIQGTYET